MNHVPANRPTGRSSPRAILRAVALGALIASFLLEVAPATAATTVSYSSFSGLQITGGPEPSNFLQVKVASGAYDVAEVAPTNPPLVTASFGCTQVGPSEAQCAITGMNKVSASMGGGDDTVDIFDGVGPATINGDNGNDRLVGGPAADTLNGGPGSDFLNGEEGADSQFGNDGSDTLAGFVGSAAPENTPAPDVWNGGAGEDGITFRAAQVPINVSLDGQANDGRAGEGDNVIAVEGIDGGQAADTLTGDDGPNVIGGRASNSGCEQQTATQFITVDTDPDVINGKGGNDILGGCGGDDQIFAGSGDDFVEAGSGADTVDGGDGADTINSPSSSLFGPDRTPGKDTVSGGDGDDLVIADSGPDVIDGGLGTDVIKYGPFTFETGSGTGFTAHGGAGNDQVFGGALRDTLNGDDGDDLVLGGNENDLVRGENGNDRLGGDGIPGTVGNDILVGGAGDDRLGVIAPPAVGQPTADNDPGVDNMQGGPGNDVLIAREAETPAMADHVNCGHELVQPAVENDVADVDLLDVVPEPDSSCEQLFRSPVGEKIHIKLLSHKAQVTNDGSVQVKIHCAKTAEKRCVGKGNVAVVGRRQGPSRHYSVARGGTETLELPLRGRDIAAARRHSARVEVTLIEPGVIGPHTVFRTLPTVAFE